MTRRKKILLALFVISILVTGFYRDFLFKSINALLNAWDYEMEYTMPAHLRFFEHFHYDTVVRIKWLLTMLFTLIYFLLSTAVIRIMFRERYFEKILLFSYSLLICAAALFFLAGALVAAWEEKTYEFARYIMGIAQSPLVLMILIPAFLLIRKSNGGQSPSSD